MNKSFQFQFITHTNANFPIRTAIQLVSYRFRQRGNGKFSRAINVQREAHVRRYVANDRIDV